MIQEYFNKAKEWALEQVLWAEREMRGKSGAEKKAAVVQKLDDMITLPAWLEWADGPVISALVDAACGLLNYECGHKWWGMVDFSKEEIKNLAKAMPDPETPEA